MVIIQFNIAAFETVAFTVIGDCHLESFHTHDGAVHFFFRQVIDDFDDILICDFCGFVKSHALDQFSERGTGSDGACTTEGLEFDVCDSAFVIQFQVQFQSIAACHISDFCNGVGIFDLAHVTGVEKVIHYFFIIIPHKSSPSFRSAKLLQGGNILRELYYYKAGLLKF